MSPDERDESLLLEMLDSAQVVEEAVEDIDIEEFITARIFRGGNLYEMMIVGEAANHLSPEIRARHPHVPWRDIIGFRHVIVHGYAGLTWERVWETVSLNVPQLRAHIQAILAAEFPDSDKKLP